MSMLTEQSFTKRNETRDIINEVMENAFESVCSTMGPNGNYVIINQLNKPKVTKDGVSVAKALDFGESRHNLIANIITEPSIKTDNEVGDGTTTTVFMTYHLYKTFADLMTFKNTRYLDSLVQEAVNYVSTLIKPGDIHSQEFRNMLMTSSNYEEEIVEKILEIYKSYKNPNITLQQCPSLGKDEIQFTKEIKFDGQFAQNSFVPQSGNIFFREGEAKVILIDGSVGSISAAFFDGINKGGVPKETIIIMARNFEPGAIAAINAMNQRLGGIIYLPYKLHAAGSLGTDTLSDLGKLLEIEPVFGLENVEFDLIKDNDIDIVLSVTGVMMSKGITVIEKRAEEILIGLDERYARQSIVDRQTAIGRELFRRIARLRANNVTVKVTGVTPSNTTERYYRYEDVMKAARTGQEFGVIPGIGYGYLMASNWIEKEFPQQSDEGLEKCRLLFINVLRQQYIHLTGKPYEGGTPTYVDLVTGEEAETPMNVYDNAAATMIALKGAWSTAKTLGKISNVMGKSNSSYA